MTSDALRAIRTPIKKMSACTPARRHFVRDPLESGKTNFLDSFIGWFTI
jgi:hypothetical protein